MTTILTRDWLAAEGVHLFVTARQELRLRASRLRRRGVPLMMHSVVIPLPPDWQTADPSVVSREVLAPQMRTLAHQVGPAATFWRIKPTRFAASSWSHVESVTQGVALLVSEASEPSGRALMQITVGADR